MKTSTVRGVGLALAMGVSASLSAGRGELKLNTGQEIRVAFDARFDAEGRAIELRRHDEAEFAPAFWAALEARLAGLKIPPAQDGLGHPAALHTGLTVTVAVTRSEQAWQLRIAGMDVNPLVVKREYVGYPKDVAQNAGWTGEIDAECMVGLDGHCSAVQVKALPGVPTSVLRWVSATMALWEFQLPEVNGQPFAAPAHQRFLLGTSEEMPAEFRERGSGNMKFRWDVKTF